MYQLEELSLEVTNECTLSCIHCSSGSTPQKLDNELTVEEHLSLIDQAAGLGATVLSLSGGNPLLCDHLPRLVERAHDLEYERILVYVTGHHRHGDLIRNYEHVEELKKYINLTWIFSMHSHNVRTNDKIMNTPGALNNIKASIFWLTSAIQRVEVHMVPMRPNYKHIPGVRDLCEVLGVRKLSLLRFVPQTRGFDNKDILSMTKQDFVWMQILMAQELERNSLVKLRLGCPIDFRHALGLLEEKAKPCHAGDDLILVRPDGAVHPCAAWKSLPSDVNVRDHDLAWIWAHGEVFNAIRSFKKHRYMLVEGCSHCSMVTSCKTGCPAQRLHAWGKGLWDLLCNWSDPLCPRGVTP